MITKLHQHGLVTYDSFLAAAHRLIESKGFALIVPAPKYDHEHASDGADSHEGAHLPATANAEVEDVHEQDDASDKTLVTTDGADNDEAANEPPSAPPAPAILAPLRDSLRSLSAALSTRSTTTLPADAFPTFAQTLEKPTPALKPLNVSLAALTDLIEAQSRASNSMAYRPYAAYSSTTSAGSGGTSSPLASGKMTELREVVSGLKAEIRSVKGVLLNRRNFASGAMREGVGA